MDATLAALREAGATVEETKAGIRVAMSCRAEPVTLSIAPYPGFATDIQAQFMAMTRLGNGHAQDTETNLQNRYVQVPELAEMALGVVARWRNTVGAADRGAE